MRYVLGLDGGGTKTDCALYDADSGRLDMLTFGSSNHEGMRRGMRDLPAAFGEIFRTMLSRNNIAMPDIEMGVLGVAGVDTTEQHRVISGILSDLGLERFILCNDSFLGIKAGSPNGIGICAISGTGYSVTGIDKTGRKLQIGGLGEYSGDIDGGSSTIRRAVALVYRQLFCEGPYTALTPAIFEWLNITDKYEFVDLLTTRLAEDRRKTILALSVILHEVAKAGDELALNHLAASGKSYAGAIAGLIGDLDFPADEELSINFAGSLFTKAECKHVQHTTERCLLERFPERKFNFRTLDISCAAGGVLWALDEIGIPEEKEKALKRFRQ